MRMHPHRGVVRVVVEAAVVTAVVCQRHPGEEDDREDEHDPGDDGDPCGAKKDPGGLV